MGTQWSHTPPATKHIQVCPIPLQSNQYPSTKEVWMRVNPLLNDTKHFVRFITTTVQNSMQLFLRIGHLNFSRGFLGNLVRWNLNAGLLCHSLKGLDKEISDVRRTLSIQCKSSVIGPDPYFGIHGHLCRSRVVTYPHANMEFRWSRVLHL